MPDQAEQFTAFCPAERQSRRAPAAIEAAFEQLVGGRTRTIRTGEEIFGEGEEAQHVYRIVSGTVRTYRLLSDGRRQVSDFLQDGDVIGPEPGLTHRNTAEAVTEVVIQTAPRLALMRLADSDPALAGALWRLSIDWRQRAQDHAMILARQGATERVAGFLLAYAASHGEETFDLPMTRQDIADHLGLTIHTVSRTLSQLQCEGLVRLQSLRRVQLLCSDALQTIAG